MTATARQTVDAYLAHNECLECGYDGELIVERGGGIVSITCPACYFSASAEEGEVGAEWQEFLGVVASLSPEESKPFLAGAALGAVRNVGLFILALLLNAVDGGRAGLGR